MQFADSRPSAHYVGAELILQSVLLVSQTYFCSLQVHVEQALTLCTYCELHILAAAQRDDAGRYQHIDASNPTCESRT